LVVDAKVNALEPTADINEFVEAFFALIEKKENK